MGDTKQTDTSVSRPSSRHQSPESSLPDRREANAPAASFTPRSPRRPFGDRVSTAFPRPPGPKNKIAPVSSPPQQLQEKWEKRATQQNHEKSQEVYSSPPYTRRRLNHEERHREERTRDHNRRSPTLQWREKTPLLEHEVTPPSAPFQPPRQSVGRNLEMTNFPSLPEMTSREEVMEDLMVATRQYLNCPDPKEQAARKDRVLLSEINGDVEEAATRILQNSAALTQMEIATATVPMADVPQSPEPQYEEFAETSTAPTKKRGRPPKDRQKRIIARTTVRLSPKTYTGMGSKKRNLARQQGLPGTSSRPSTRQDKICALRM
ncbi:hypothetical protein Bca4012_002481 [Brassica carinata]